MGYYSKLKSVVDEIDVLLNSQVTSDDPAFKAWRAKVERLLIKLYGEDSYEYKDFKKYRFTLTVCTLGTPHSEFVKACSRDLISVKAVLATYIDELLEDGEEQIQSFANNSRVFIVHGRDEAMKEAVARLVEKQGLNAIILNEQPNKGRTLIEKIESYSDVGVAICLLTADDTGCRKDEDVSVFRARQNVIFEAGYFIGKIGRDRVITIVDEKVEIPSDLNGIAYTNSNGWKLELLSELHGLGYRVDFKEMI